LVLVLGVLGGQRGFKGLRGVVQVPETIGVFDPDLDRFCACPLGAMPNHIGHLAQPASLGGKVQ